MAKSPESASAYAARDAAQRGQGVCPGWDGLRLAQCLRNILYHSNDGIAVVDADNVVRCWSASAQRIFGYSAEEMLGRKVDILAPAHLRAAGELERIDQTVRDEGILLGHRTMRVTKSGTPIVIELSASAIYDDNDAMIGRLSIFRDLTEANRMERRMRQSQRLSTVAQLVTGLAHEIGTPLNVITGRAELMMMNMAPNDPHRRELQVIISESERVAELIRTLLQFARGSPHARLRRCSLNAIVHDVIRLVERQLRVANITIHADLAARLPLLSVNRMQIVEVVLNLVVNAWHAMPDGGKLTLATNVRERGDGQWVELRVADTGKGIDPQNFDKIFNPFFSTKSPGQGTGLGLTVVLNIVERHGGLIDFSSAPGQGTTFLVSFPIQRLRGQGATRPAHKEDGDESGFEV